MKILRLPVLVSSLFFCFFLMIANNGSTADTSKQPYSQDQIIIKLRSRLPGARPSTAEELMIDRRSLPPVRAVEELSSSRDTFLLKLEGISVPEAILQAYRDPRVEYAGPDYYCYPADNVPDDPFFEFMWSLRNIGPEPFAGKIGADIGAVKAWGLTTGSSEAVAVILDTGTDIAHPDLAENVWVNTEEVPGNGLDDDGNGYVDDVHGWNFLDDSSEIFHDPAVDRHGTHVAGILGAVGNNGIGVTGVAWQVKLMALKFLDGQENRGLISNAVRAINYVIDQQKKGANVVVINASWVTPGRSRALREAIAAAGEAGILFVCAAGNEGRDLDENPIYPAARSRDISTVVSVAALDRFDRLESYSNYGHETVTVGAPGTDVLSLAPSGGYVESSGTSMAAPHVSGIAVLMWALDPSISPEEIKNRLVIAAKPVPLLGSYCASGGRAHAFGSLTTMTASRSKPEIARIEASKRTLEIDGIGFLIGSSVVEINGLAVGTIKYKSDYRVSNGTLTKLVVKLGKERMNEICPLGEPVTITVFNSTTGERSEPFEFTRRKGPPLPE